MSTKLTQEGSVLVDSNALKLVLETAKINDLTTAYLSNSLKNRGYEGATAAALVFLSALECGVNYGAEIARNLGVSRQMVAKTVKQLCHVGYLAQIDGVGKQKEILFTNIGELLMADARHLLAALDQTLSEQLAEGEVEATMTSLAKIRCIMAELSGT